MSFFAFELSNNDWYMLEGRYDTVAEAQAFIDELSEQVTEIQADFNEPIKPGTFKIVDEKDTVAQAAVITVANATLYRAAWGDVSVGSDVFIYNPKNKSIPRWGVKNSSSTSKHGNEVINFDPSYEYFTLEDRYSIEWQESLDELWARTMKKQGFPEDCVNRFIQMAAEGRAKEREELKKKGLSA